MVTYCLFHLFLVYHLVEMLSKLGLDLVVVLLLLLLGLVLALAHLAVLFCFLLAPTMPPRPSPLSIFCWYIIWLKCFPILDWISSSFYYYCCSLLFSFSFSFISRCFSAVIGTDDASSSSSSFATVDGDEDDEDNDVIIVLRVF